MKSFNSLLQETVTRSHIEIIPGMFSAMKIKNFGASITDIIAKIPVDIYGYPVASPNDAPFKAGNIPSMKNGFTVQAQPGMYEQWDEIEALIEENLDPEPYKQDQYKEAFASAVELLQTFYVDMFKEEYDVNAELKLEQAAAALVETLGAHKRSEIEKKIHAGDNIGKPGKGFAKIEKKAAARYGSKKAGERVAAAVMWKNLAKEEIFAGLESSKGLTEELVTEMTYAKTQSPSVEVMPDNAAAALVLAKKYAHLAKNGDSALSEQHARIAQDFFNTANRTLHAAVRSLPHEHDVDKGPKKLVASESIIEVDTPLEMLKLASTEENGIDFELPSGAIVEISPETARELLAQFEEKNEANPVLVEEFNNFVVRELEEFVESATLEESNK